MPPKSLQGLVSSPSPILLPLKIMKTHNGLLIGSGFAASVFAFGIASGAISLKDASIASLVGIPAALISHTLTDSIAQKRINQADERVKRLERELESALSKTAFSEDIEARSQHLAEEIDKVRSALDLAIGEHQKAADFNLYLQQSLSALQADLEASQGKVEELQAECEVWEEEFSDRVESAADAKFQQAKKAEIERIFQEHDAITSQAIALFQRLQGWGEKVAHGHQTKREIIKNLATSYNANLDELGQLVEKERGHYIEQIELLHEKVGRLQHQINGDLVEPEYLPVAYSVEGRIANDIAREIFTTLQIPLAVRGYHTKPDGSTDVALGYSRSMGSVALVEALKRQSEAIAKSLRIHKITSIRKLEIADLIVLSFRRDPAVKEDTVKLIAGSPEQFLEYVASHPIRYRLIADPGTGKTPITAVMVSEILKVGGTRGNTGKGRKIPNTLVTVSCPDVESSQKDADYPLEIFLQYGNTTAAVKSFSDEETTNKAQLTKRSFLAGTAGDRLASNSSTPDSVSTSLKMTVPSNPTIGGDCQSSQKPHCPHCGSDFLNLLNDGRYRCLDCKKRFVTSKIVWK